MPELPIEYLNDEVQQTRDTNDLAGNTHNEVVLSIPSDASYVRVVRLAVMGIASRMAFSFEDIEDIKLAVSEACNNAILHARPSTQNQEPDSVDTAPSTMPVVVRLVAHTDRLEINVEDHGVIENPGLLHHPTTDPTVLGDLPEGGMGLFLIETLMDEVEHETGEKTVVRMTKYVHPSDKSALSTPPREQTASSSSMLSSVEKPSAAN